MAKNETKVKKEATDEAEAEKGMVRYNITPVGEFAIAIAQQLELGEAESNELELIPLSEPVIGANFRYALIGNLLERVPMPRGGKATWDWSCFRFELLRPLHAENDETGEVLDLTAGSFVLIPATARLTALERFLGSAIALRPREQKVIERKPDGTPKRVMWEYDGVLISRTKLQPI